MADARRIKRLEKAIYQAIAPLVSQRLADPRLQMITVTRIRLSRDLAIARVNWSMIGTPADRSKAAHALEDARGLLQAAVAGSTQTRTTPHLVFHFDESVAGAARIHEILGQISDERRASEDSEVDEAGDSDTGESESGEHAAREQTDGDASEDEGVSPS